MTKRIHFNRLAYGCSLIGLLITLVMAPSAKAQASTQMVEETEVAALRSRVTKLETRVSQAEQIIAKGKDSILPLFLFGAFCALWAQNTGRSAWLWFFLGLFFSVITVIVLLSKNSRDLSRLREAEQGRGNASLEERLFEACLDRSAKETP